MSFQDVVYYRMLRCKPCDIKLAALWIKDKIWKKTSFIYVRNMAFLTYFLKECTTKVLNIYKSIATENFKPMLLCFIKWQPIKVFVKLYISPTLIANIFKVAFSGLRHFLVTDSLSKLKKNTFSFTLKALFVLKIFKFKWFD